MSYYAAFDRLLSIMKEYRGISGDAEELHRVAVEVDKTTSRLLGIILHPRPGTPPEVIEAAEAFARELGKHLVRPVP